MQENDYLTIDEDENQDPEQGILKEIKEKTRKSRTKEINVMNKKKLSKYELDDYMMEASFEADADESDF